MIDFIRLRQSMVQAQITGRGIKDAKVIGAMKKIPRQEFILEDLRARAYEDGPLSIGEGQTISQPYMVALMTQSLELKKSDRVLEIGTGSGYQTAVLGEISRDVYTIERSPVLSQRAKAVLDKLGYTNIHFQIGDGTMGWSEREMSFDAVLVTAASPHLPGPLINQLADSGRIVIPLGERSGQTLMLYQKTRTGIESKFLCSCIFVPLLGKHGWNC